jgi:hypothetical protein
MTSVPDLPPGMKTGNEQVPAQTVESPESYWVRSMGNRSAVRHLIGSYGVCLTSWLTAVIYAHG